MFPEQGDACLMCRETWWAVSKPPGARAGMGWGYLQGNGRFSGKQQWAEDLGLGGGCKACMNGLWEPQSRGSTWGAGQD